MTKAALHQLVDDLPESEYATAARVLEALGYVGDDEPLYTMETAPIDDEPETEEERLAVEEAKRELARGERIPIADIYRQFGR